LHSLINCFPAVSPVRQSGLPFIEGLGKSKMLLDIFNSAVQSTDPSISQSREELYNTIFIPYWRQNLENGNPSDAAGLDSFNKYFFPSFHFIKTMYNNHIIKITSTHKHNTPFFIAMSAPQGCGKTTFTDLVCKLFAHTGVNCVSMSLDDFYLTGSDQDAIAAQYHSNPLLQYRGNAGTHDLKLALDTLEALKTVEPGSPVSIPRYDKSLRAGRGDRSPPSRWTAIDSRVDVVLFEGWMLGFTPTELQSPAAGASSCEALSVPEDIPTEGIQEVDRLLHSYRTLHDLFDLWLLLAVKDLSQVFAWRLEAEHKMLAAGRAGLTDSQVRDFVLRFMPAYAKYAPFMYAHGPQRQEGVPVLKICVDKDRQPTTVDVID